MWVTRKLTRIFIKKVDMPIRDRQILMKDQNGVLLVLKVRRGGKITHMVVNQQGFRILSRFHIRVKEL